MAQAPLIPVPFSTLPRLVATASRFCGRTSSVLHVGTCRKMIRSGDVLRLALLAPEIRFPIDVHATVLARTFRPDTIQVRYELADLAQMECALGQLYQSRAPALPMSLDVATFHGRRCRLSGLSQRGATFEVMGELSTRNCPPDASAKLQLPHQKGRVELPGRIAWVTPRREASRLHLSFGAVGDSARRMLDDIVFRFQLGAAPWTPRLLAPGL
ncbi:MAG: PilZ domain-containing protein [Archangiaceae bacterium]|nr:PilZ domain-containing protein [Archangiaceae bacterium]